jgi:YidC/Oxa1 family membrane protein insertase
MDKRTVLAFIISLAILVVWGIFFTPRTTPPPAPPAAPAGATGTAQAGGVEPGTGAGSATTAESEPGGGTDAAATASQGADDGAPRAPRREAPAGAPPTIVETQLARVTFDSLGGCVHSWTLKEYKDHRHQPYELVSLAAKATKTYPFQLRLDDKPLEGFLNTRARYVVERGLIGASDGGEVPPAASAPATDTAANTASTPGTEEVRLVYSDGQGLEVVKTFVFTRDSYLVRFSASVTRNGQRIPAAVVWGLGIGTPTEDDLAYTHYEGGTAVVLPGGSALQRLTGAYVETNQKLDALRWAGIEEKYFAAVFIPLDGAGSAEIIPTSFPSAPEPEAHLRDTPETKPVPAKRLAIAVPAGESYSLFAGPKDYELLQGLGLRLEDLVHFSYPIPIIGPLTGALASVLLLALRALHKYIPNYGVCIIVMTAAIRILFYPITQRTMVKMRQVQQQMAKLKPKVDAIKNRYKKAKDIATRNKQNEEIMELYRREGVNPMASLGGCLPLLLQMPILLALNSLLTVSIELRQAPFVGWIQDLSWRDPYYITPIVMGATMFLQQKLAMPANVTDPQQKMQQRMMLIMPIIFTYTFLHLPSGLVLYWFVNNVLGIAQQVLINRQAKALDAQMAEAAGKA